MSYFIWSNFLLVSPSSTTHTLSSYTRTHFNLIFLTPKRRFLFKPFLAPSLDVEGLLYTGF